MKQTLSVVCLVVLTIASCVRIDGSPDSTASSYDEYTVAQIHEAMDAGELTAIGLVDYYLERIEALDRSGPELRSIIEVNPDARAIAEALDAQDGERGPLHGIPVVLKANVDTGDAMATTAGALAIAGHHASDDAAIAKQLRDAGAVILGKTNLSEWANFRSTRSSSGWSGIGGQVKNPYDTLRNPCGSSSGSGVAISANLAMLAIGTETDGSIVCPSSINGIVGIKPTLGLVSRDGIIPIAHSQDTAGPMARTVRDAALMLNAISAADPSDPAAADRPETIPDYTADLTADGLQGKRIGVIRSYGGAGDNPDVEKTFEGVIEVLKAQGAEIVDPIEIETEPMKTLADVIEFNEANADRAMPIFGQEILEMAEAKGPLTDQEYLDALETSKRLARSGIDDTMAEHDLDALIAPTNGPAWMTDHVNGDNFSVGSSSLAAVSGYASVTVPAGFSFDLPLGVSFIGGAFSEHDLIRMAYAFEQASKARRAPKLD
jgi:amidase